MMEFVQDNLLIVIYCIVIIGFFFFFAYQIYNVWRAKNLLSKISEESDMLNAIQKSKLKSLSDSYFSTFKVKDNSKTNVLSEEIFSFENISRCFNVNPQMLNIASGTLVGLGLLGTFLGLTIGVSGFNNESTAKIQESIQGLLDGMATAFFTSLFGMGLSIFYSFGDKGIRHRFNKVLNDFNRKLDNQYFRDDITVINERLDAIMYFTDDDGNKIKISNAIRDILDNNAKQTSALKTFSSDLALGLNDIFGNTIDEKVVRQIIPQMEKIEEATHEVSAHVDELANKMASPASDMIETVVEQLHKSMGTMMEEFRSNLSGSATDQLEKLAMNLGEATKSMADFPKNMENISQTLQVTIEEVKTAISEISNTSATSNSNAMKQMQEQITFATTSISNSIAKVEEVMSTITKKSEESSNEVVNKLTDAASKMTAFLDTTVVSLSTSMADSFKSITDDVNAKQADLIALQEDSTTQTKKLLEQFNTGLDRLEKMNEYVSGTMNQFTLAQGQITGSTAHLQTITSDMKTATEVFHKTQADYNDSVKSIQTITDNSFNKITELLNHTAKSSDTYVEQFETIKLGLSSIFAQLQKGLTDYSTSVQANTQKFLDAYTTNLTETTGALANTISQQNDVVELLNETLSKSRKV